MTEMRKENKQYKSRGDV